MARFALHSLNLAPSTVQIVWSCGATRKAASIKINLSFGLAFLEIWFSYLALLHRKPDNPQSIDKFSACENWMDRSATCKFSLWKFRFLIHICKGHAFFVILGMIKFLYIMIIITVSIFQMVGLGLGCLCKEIFG